MMTKKAKSKMLASTALTSPHMARFANAARTADSDKPKRREKPDVPAAVLSISEFCAMHQISQSMFFKMRSLGLGPREMRIGAKVVISLEAAAEWRKAREQVQS